MWHWRRYYTHLTNADEIAELADRWAIAYEFQAQDWTLAEANRSASRELYHYARNEGWRKLTLRERDKLGASVQWVRQEWVAERLIELGFAGGDATGTGEETRRNASGIEDPQ